MSRMIPGRIRNQGIELYEQGLVSLISQEGNLLKAKVGDCQIEYSLVTEETKCSCDFCKKRLLSTFSCSGAFLEKRSRR